MSGYDDDLNIERKWDRALVTICMVLVLASVLWAASGCTIQQPAIKPVSPLKLCAQALVSIQAAQDCTLNGPNICMFTEGDMEHIIQAQADKQVYCPRLQPGQEEANQ